MGACHPCGAVVPCPDAAVGRHGPRAPGRCQRRVGFGDSLPVRLPPINDGVAAFGCSMGAGDNLVRGVTGGALCRPANKDSSGLFQDELVQQRDNWGYKMQPEPPVLPSNLLVASSTTRLLRLPMRVHRACGSEGQCAESCSCLTSASWKLVPASA